MSPISFEPLVPPTRDPLWADLAHPVLRDLAWLLDCPPLVQTETDWTPLTFAAQLGVDVQVWLREQAANPESLLAYIGEVDNLRLGLYAERLLCAFFERALALSFQHNLPVREGSQTLGALDFWLDCRGRTLPFDFYHLELAVKFYLWRADETGVADFIGPRGQDRLRYKVHKLLQQQVLSRHSACAVSEYADSAQSAIWMPGRLFYPWREQAHVVRQAQAAFPHLHPAHPQACWVSIDDQAFWESYPTAEWVMVPRIRWLAPLVGVVETQSGAAWLASLSAAVNSAQAVMVAQINAGVEIQRVCVVAPQALSAE